MLSKEKLAKFTKKSEFILLLEIVIYTFFFSLITVLRYYSFQTYAYDLGNYNQALHTTLFDGKFLYYTADLLANPSGSLFGVHFSPIFLVILPLYAIYPSPVTLLVLQSFVLSLGALPLYYLTKKELGSEKWGIVFATLYLLNPALQGVNWFDFHPEAFLPALLLFAFFFFESNRISGYFASVVLALMCLEFTSVVLLFVCLYFVVKLKPWRNRNVNSRKIQMLSLTFVLSFVWLLMSLQIIHAFNSSVLPLTGEVYWREIGANSLLDVPVQVILHPTRLISALSFDGWQKISYALILVGSVAFLPLLEPSIIICMLPWLTVAFLSNFQPFYQFGTQYPAFIIPFVFYGAVLGIKKLKHLGNGHYWKGKKFRIVLAGFFSFSILIFFFVTPLNNMPYQNSNYFTYGLPIVTQHDQDVLKLLQLIPQNASVLTQSNIFPLLSGRPNAYVFPSAVFYPPNMSFSNALDDLLGKVDFIVVDLESDLIGASTILSYLSQNSQFGVYASAGGAVLLKRDFSGAPLLFKPLEDNYDYKSLLLYNGVVVKDPDSSSGYSLMHSESNASGTDFWYGPYVFLPPGQYEATFEIKIQQPTNGYLISLDVSYFSYGISIGYLGTKNAGYSLNFSIGATGVKTLLISRKLDTSDFNETDRYYDFSLNFTVSELGSFEFSGIDVTNNADVFLEGIRLTQVEPSANLTAQVRDMIPG